MERTSRDEHSYICLPEHASSFAQTKLPEIYTKDEINKMFYGVYGGQEKNEDRSNTEGDFIDLGIHRPSTRSISIDRRTHQHIDRQSQKDIDRRSYKPRQASTKGDIRQIAEDRKHSYNNEGEMVQRR
ncbi:hypothetical protein F2Q70_00004126 [Brassica cretica]|uniref:Uncharacterized protein n=1 Tax=Brassica cretica TaxID=69181 RepID=A0A8S9J0R2_BRACR|nr:hypothetical protein F2Q70_00004126 [Brassica cretica]